MWSNHKTYIMSIILTVHIESVENQFTFHTIPFLPKLARILIYTVRKICEHIAEINVSH